MRIICIIVAMVSLLMIGFSLFFGYKVSRLEADYSAADRLRAGRQESGYLNDDDDDRRLAAQRLRASDFERFSREQRALHTIVKAVSYAYFLLVIGIAVLALLRRPVRRSVRVSAITAITIAVAMTFWSFIISGAVDFGEIFLAWVAASLVLGALVLVIGVSGKRRESNAGRPPELPINAA